MADGSASHTGDAAAKRPAVGQVPNRPTVTPDGSLPRVPAGSPGPDQTPRLIVWTGRAADFRTGRVDLLLFRMGRPEVIRIAPGNGICQAGHSFLQ